ncbi:MAG: shikimate kinase, partial [Halieaceae bacterium]|nr:shikimate kinase [Halieaceae bacterium]
EKFTRVYKVLKYVVYALLSVNIVLFLNEEVASAAHATTSDLDIFTGIQLFSATLDTAAWVLLLLLFELETAVIPDDQLVGRTQWVIHGVRLICGLAIVSACWGYFVEWQVFWSSSLLSMPACELVGQGWSILLDFDIFTALDAQSCVALGSEVVAITELERVVATPAALDSAYQLGLVDVINAVTWILVVVLLEIEVRLQLWGGVPRRFQRPLNGIKVVLYLTLAVAAVYWGFEGEFLDFWDAALWLFAFVFIELNVFEWQRDLARQAQD